MSFLRKPSDPHAILSVFPTFLLPSVPFRRKSRQSSTDSDISTTSSTFTTSSLASTNTTASSTNPFSRCPTPLPLPQHDTLILPPTDKFLHGHTSHIHCAKCSTDLCLTSQIISKGFTGRHGRAYLVQGSTKPGHGMHVTTSTLPNTYLSKSVPRNLVTGQHTVADLSCAICGSLLGWKYVEAAEESQKYKVGKFILETKKIRVGVRWEGQEDDHVVGHDGFDEVVVVAAADVRRLKERERDRDAGGIGTTRADREKDDVEFDSQDEDECEDLFAGVWSPTLAGKRRVRRRERERMGRRAKFVALPSRSQDSLG